MLGSWEGKRKRKRERSDDHAIMPVSSHHSTRQLLACCRRFSFVGARGDGDGNQIGRLERGDGVGKKHRVCPVPPQNARLQRPFFRAALEPLDKNLVSKQGPFFPEPANLGV